MSYQFEICHQFEPFFSEPRIWDALSGGVAFRETAWLAPWWRHLGSAHEPFLVIARKPSGQICGLLPLYRKPTAAGRTLATLGDGSACTDYVSVLSRAEEARHVGEAIGEFLAGAASDADNGWDVIDIDGIVEGDVAMSALARGLRNGRASLHTVSRMRTWFKPTDASWAEHLKHYGKTQRRRMRRMSEKIGSEGPMEVVVANTASDVDEMLGSLIQMHQRRWESVGERGSYADKNFQSFMFDAAKAFLELDRLYLNLVRFEGRDIGAELNFIGENRVLYCYGAGYDIDSADLEPGRLVNIDTLQHLYRDGLAGIDFMRGDETYKQRLSTCSRRVLRLRAVVPTIVPRLLHAAWCTGFEFKQWMRRQSGRTPVETIDITTPIPTYDAEQPITL